MRQLLIVPFLAVALLLGFGGAALADGTVPVSIFGGSYFGMSDDHSAIAFKMPDGRIRWEVNGVPISNYGVDDVARAAMVGYESPQVLVLYGRIRGTYFASSSDGSAIAYRMPDGTLRWEINGVPIFPR